MALSVDVDTSELTMPQVATPLGKGYYLVLDTETYRAIGGAEDNPQIDTGIEHLPPVAISWQVLDEQGQCIREESYLIRQERETEPMTEEAIELHGITQEAMLGGLTPQEAYRKLLKVASEVECIVAHNAHFHLSVLAQDMEAVGMGQEAEMLLEKASLCTMQWGRSLGFKTWRGGEALYPRLDELFGYLYFRRMHIPLRYRSKTLRDVRLCAACLRRKL